jgi:hypothetical protein
MLAGSLELEVGCMAGWMIPVGCGCAKWQLPLANWPKPMQFDVNSVNWYRYAVHYAEKKQVCILMLYNVFLHPSAKHDRQSRKQTTTPVYP